MGVSRNSTEVRLNATGGVAKEAWRSGVSYTPSGSGVAQIVTGVGTFLTPNLTEFDDCEHGYPQITDYHLLGPTTLESILYAGQGSGVISHRGVGVNNRSEGGCLMQQT